MTGEELYNLIRDAKQAQQGIAIQPWSGLAPRVHIVYGVVAQQIGGGTPVKRSGEELYDLFHDTLVYTTTKKKLGWHMRKGTTHQEWDAFAAVLNAYNPTVPASQPVPAPPEPILIGQDESLALTALRKFGRHAPNCYTGAECICGFEQMQKDLGLR